MSRHIGRSESRFPRADGPVACGAMVAALIDTGQTEKDDAPPYLWIEGTACDV